MEQEIHIRLFEDYGEQMCFVWPEFYITDFGGHLPIVGDLIIHPLVEAKLNRNEPENRTVYEVLARYFMPQSRSDHTTCVVLTVKPHVGTFKEVDILLLS